MSYTLVKKNIPTLIDSQLVKKIARLNNVDYKTGMPLETPVYTHFKLVCSNIKRSFLLLMINNWLLIILIIIISVFLYKRYHAVKAEKILREIQNKQNALIKKKQDELLEAELKQIELDNYRSKLEMNAILEKYENFDDSRARQKLIPNFKTEEPIVARNEINNIYRNSLASI